MKWTSQNGPWLLRLHLDSRTLSNYPHKRLVRFFGTRPSVEGPVPPDTVFVKALAGQYDVVVAMYHDQGHIPLKLCGFKIDPNTGKFTSMSGINTTIGLPIIRTSVDHGTAFDVAGKGIANEESMVDAILLAARMALARRNTP